MFDIILTGVPRQPVAGLSGVLYSDELHRAIKLTSLHNCTVRPTWMGLSKESYKHTCTATSCAMHVGAQVIRHT